MSQIIRFDCGTIHPTGLHVQANTYVIVFETNHGMVMIDSGYGIQDFMHPNLVTRFFTSFVHTPRDPVYCAINQLPKFNVDPHDVKHIILTHMHIDHAGGIADFPWAKIHVWEQELLSALHHRGKLGIGYNTSQWKNHDLWQTYNMTNCEWFGLPAVQLAEFSPEIFLIPTPGHTPGHCMVAFRSENKWILQTGSAGYPFYEQDENRQVNAPDWFKFWLMGNHIPRLKKLWLEQNQEIEFLSSHEFRKAEKID
ncbi:MAG: hypothetical protein CVU46_12685 [Chloroflexi bacterium HGW-Chloroflexi-8]|jgi:glyoxylase-like metal-dependent hydrolase (beta-lactamase superfamily II)|nr:MAG: hypothetical protein CVU46_12685 [Chloroflexi bacterium HGW-Chloroflexi-8]